MRSNLDGPGAGFWALFVVALVASLVPTVVCIWAVIELVQWVTSK